MIFIGVMRILLEGVRIFVGCATGWLSIKVSRLVHIQVQDIQTLSHIINITHITVHTLCRYYL